MRWWTAAFLLTGFALQAQTSMPSGVVHGKLVSWAGSARAGEFIISNSEGLRSCLFDARTYFERDHQMVAITGLIAGDPLEIVADRKPGSSNCYARTVQVTGAAPQLFVPGIRPPLRSFSSPTESFAPRGDFMFGGRLVRRESAKLTVKTRAGEIHVALRPDTRYVDGGLSVDAASLPVNTHIFVRAGHNLEGLLEAYQVIWGDIVAPQ